MTILADQERKKRWQQFVASLETDIEPKALRLMDEMRLVSHALMKIGENSLAATGLSYAQYRVLMSLYISALIDQEEAMNPSEISTMQGTSRNTISALIRGLEARGLLERRLDPEDRRKFDISLTPEGRRVVRENARQHMRSISRCFGVLTPEEQDRLSDLLVKIGRGLAQMTPSESPQT